MILLDATTEGAILPLDSEKLPAELKHEDVVDNDRLFAITKKDSENQKDLDSISDSGSDSGASGCTPLGDSNRYVVELLDDHKHYIFHLIILVRQHNNPKQPHQVPPLHRTRWIFYPIVMI